MRYHVEPTQTTSISTAVIRGCVAAGELSRFVPAACGEVWSFVRASGLPKPGRHVSLYLDDRGSVEVGVEVAEPFDGNGRVHCSQLPAGRVATTVHFGPYSGLSEAHRAIREWCAEQQLAISGTCWEVYGHWEESWNADPSKIRTEVFHLLDEPDG